MWLMNKLFEKKQFFLIILVASGVIFTSGLQQNAMATSHYSSTGKQYSIGSSTTNCFTDHLGFNFTGALDGSAYYQFLGASSGAGARKCIDSITRWNLSFIPVNSTISNLKIVNTDYGGNPFASPYCDWTQIANDPRTVLAPDNQTSYFIGAGMVQNSSKVYVTGDSNCVNNNPTQPTAVTWNMNLTNSIPSDLQTSVTSGTGWFAIGGILDPQTVSTGSSYWGYGITQELDFNYTDVPQPPTNLTATAVSSSQINLNWTAPSNNGGSPITHYVIYRGSFFGGETLLSTIGNVTSYSDTTVSGSQSYFYKVTAVNSIGESAQSNEAHVLQQNVLIGQYSSTGKGYSIGSSTTSCYTDHYGQNYTNIVGGGDFYNQVGIQKHGTSRGWCIDNIVRWDLSSIPTSATLTSLNIKNHAAGGDIFFGNQISCNWVQIASDPKVVLAPNNSTSFFIGAGLVQNSSNTYVNNDLNCRLPKTTGNPYPTRDWNMTLANSIPSDLQTAISSGAHWFAIGGRVTNQNDNINGSQAGTVWDGITQELDLNYTLPPVAPQPPTNLTATAVASSQINLNWTTPSSNGGSSITGYKIERNNGTGFTILVGSTGSTATKYNNTGLIHSTTYTYRVSAINSVGTSSPSNNATAITFNVMPNPPTNLVATAVSSSKITLSWTAPTDNGGSTITGYEIDRSIDGGSTWSTVVGSTGNSTTTYSNTDLIHSTTYTYRVSAINSVGTSSPSNNATAITFNIVPSLPLGLTAAPSSSSQIHLSWSAPSDNGGTPINGYKIERSTNGGNTWSTLVANTTNTGTTYSDTGLTTVKTYTYRVSAINHVGISSPSNMASVTTDATSTDTRLESSGEQRTSYFNGTINYEFYYNGTSLNIFYRYSKDGGNTWLAPMSTSSGTLASNSYFSVYGNKSNVIISYANTANVLTKKGTINNDGSIAWPSAVTVTAVSGTTPGQQYYPSFTQVGSTLFLEFNVNTKSGSKTGNFGYVYSSSNLGGSWTSQSINPLYSGETNPAVVGIAKYGSTKAIAMFAKYGSSEFNYATYTGTWNSILSTSGAGLTVNALKTQAFSVTSNGTCAWVGYVPSNSGGTLKSAIYCNTFTFLATPVTPTNILHPTISAIGNNIHLVYERGNSVYRIISINQVWTPVIASDNANNATYPHAEKYGYGGNHVPIVWRQGSVSPYTVHFLSEDIDTDKDGLYNSWEINGIDYNGDGIIDLTLPGADPLHKDIFVEVDYMQGYSPNPTAINAVVAAFSKAPVTNPNGINGVKLHVLTDEQIPFHTNMNVWADFDTNKTAYFGTATERSNSNHVNILNAKKSVYHYNLWVNQFNNDASSGISELPGNDFVVSLGSFVGVVDYQEGTFMHELGHNLGLHHGGNVDTNCKPNYLSVMSYSRQFSIYVSNRNLDYSNSTLASLDESSLNEPAGISSTNPVQTTIFWNGAGTSLTPTGVPVDWNGNGYATDTGVIQDINSIPGACTADGNEVENGYIDWANLQYNFTGDRNFPNGAHLGSPDEMTTNQIEDGLLYNIETVDKMIQNIPDSDFANAKSAEGIRNSFHNDLMVDSGNAYTLAKNHDLKNTVSVLKEIRAKMNGVEGSNKSDDLIINSHTRMKIFVGLDNAIGAFEVAQNLPIDVHH
jgi:hypothetical protein